MSRIDCNYLYVPTLKTKHYWILVMVDRNSMGGIEWAVMRSCCICLLTSPCARPRPRARTPQLPQAQAAAPHPQLRGRRHRAAGEQVRAVRWVTPVSNTWHGSDKEAELDYMDLYSCWPPPLFMVTMSVVQVLYTDTMLFYPTIARKYFVKTQT